LVLLDRSPPDEYWRRALEIEKAAGALRHGGPTLAYAFAKFFQGDFGTTSELARLVADSMRSRGDPMLPHVLIDMSELARISGDWDAASRYLEEADDLVIQTGHESLEPLCLLWKARLALPRGDLEFARRHVEDAMALLERIAASDVERRAIEGLIESVLGQIAAALGRNAEAHERTTAAIEITQQLGKMSEPALAELLAGDVVCLVALGALDEAAQQLERLVELTTTLEMPDLKGFVARAQGLVAAAQGDSVAALRYLEAAVESFETLRSPWPFQHAMTLLMLGEMERRARRKLAARETLGRALEIFDLLGARLWAEKTRAELRRISGRPARSSNLTAIEQRVADLVAGGRSNAEVAYELSISPKTVEWNLSKIYKKLHVRSRTELAGKLAQKQAVSS
jgi:ATP/maltotriose-dependent transcriptional regulator MalT